MARAGRRSGGVVLVHGVRETRRAMLDRARFLHRAGYAVLLFDLPAHGESEGDRVTFGAGEASAVRAAVDLLAESLPTQPIAALGFSLGGAACLLGHEPLPVDALVLEAVYADIDTAVANRLRLYAGAAVPGSRRCSSGSSGRAGGSTCARCARSTPSPASARRCC